MIQLTIIYFFADWGCVALDLDHHWDSAPNKNTLDRIINYILHITYPLYNLLDKNLSAARKRRSSFYHAAKFLNSSHRSWQTHSDLTVVLILGVMYLTFYNYFGLSVTDQSILLLIECGAGIGMLSHLLLDMLTPSGIWCVPSLLLNKLLSLLRHKKTVFFPEKYHFVPNEKFFKTGGAWERFIYHILCIASVVMFGLLIYDMYFFEILR